MIGHRIGEELHKGFGHDKRDAPEIGNGGHDNKRRRVEGKRRLWAISRC
jgi:hypothetical protein